MDIITKYIFDKVKKENPKLSRQQIRKLISQRIKQMEREQKQEVKNE